MSRTAILFIFTTCVIAACTTIVFRPNALDELVRPVNADALGDLRSEVKALSEEVRLLRSELDAVRQAAGQAQSQSAFQPKAAPLPMSVESHGVSDKAATPAPVPVVSRPVPAPVAVESPPAPKPKAAPPSVEPEPRVVQPEVPKPVSPENERKQVFMELVKAVDDFGVGDAGKAAWKDIRAKHGLNVQATVKILDEGFNEGWEMPPLKVTAQNKAYRVEWIKKRTQSRREPLLGPGDN